jgi:hypothetical protein
MPISGEKVQDRARDTAVALPGVSHGRPFTEQLDVYKAAGKVFLIVTDDLDERIVTLKAEPEYGRLLRQEHPTTRSSPASGSLRSPNQPASLPVDLGALMVCLGSPCARSLEQRTRRVRLGSNAAAPSAVGGIGAPDSVRAVERASSFELARR